MASLSLRERRAISRVEGKIERFDFVISGSAREPLFIDRHRFIPLDAPIDR
jgi:hypothetical protein